MLYQLKLNGKIADSTTCETLADARRYFAKSHPLDEYATLGYAIEWEGGITSAMPRVISGFQRPLLPLKKAFGL